MNTLASGSIQRKRWIALLGRRDVPTDGVEDYCIFLGRGLAILDVELKRVRVPWLDKGWVRSLSQLSRASIAWRGSWVLMQYTAFTWSQRGFPIPALIVLALLRLCGARVAIVFHEPCRQGRGRRWIDHLRGTCQDWVIHRLYRGAEKSIFTVPLEAVDWLPKGENKAKFIPIGANLPERLNRRGAPPSLDKSKTVIVFGVTGAPAMADEVELIASVMQRAGRAVDKLRLVAVGRGSVEAREKLVDAMRGSVVEVVALGVLPAERVAWEFRQADALLFVRGAITPQRGSVMAGVASGIPIVGYGNGKAIGPLQETGIEWSPSRNFEDLSRCLVRVLTDPTHWMELQERNLAAQENYFSWSRIAEQFYSALNAGDVSH
jgi:glycosyltransferase involved in cell wall biosynthesis